MSGDEDVRDDDREHLDTERCCECGDTRHVCQDCPTFMGDVINVGSIERDEGHVIRRSPTT